MSSDNTALDNTALILDLVGWIAAAPRTYAQVMDAWRTSCPRLTIWEDAVDRGLVHREVRGGVTMVQVTAVGLELLRRHGRPTVEAPVRVAAE